MHKLSKDYFMCALVRAIKTICQTALSMLTIGQAIMEINWIHIVSVSAVAGLCSMLTSFATDIPEANDQGTLFIDTSDTQTDVYRLSMNMPLYMLGQRKSVTLKVDPNANLSA